MSRFARVAHRLHRVVTLREGVAVDSNERPVEVQWDGCQVLVTCRLTLTIGMGGGSSKGIFLVRSATYRGEDA